MNNFEIKSIDKSEDEILYGIFDKSTNKMVVDNLYYQIFYGELLNHQDLSMNNVVSMFSFYESAEDYTNDILHFGYIKDENIFISNHKYENLSFFYKGITVYQNDNGEHIYIDLEENIIEGPNDFYIYERDSSNDIKDELIKLHQQSLSTISDFTDSDDYENYGYGIAQVDEIPLINGVELGVAYGLNIDARQFLPIENQLGILENANYVNNYGTYTSLLYDQFEPFNYSTGVCKVFDQGRVAFMNRYFMPVGDWFDELLLEDIFFDNNDNCYYIVKKDGVTNSRYVVGNFIEEFLKAPYLFFEFSHVKEHYINKFNITEINYEYSNRNYFKFDRLILQNEIRENLSEEISDQEKNDWINQYIQTEDFLNNLNDYLPFHPNSDLMNDKLQLDNLIKEHNRVFGIIPSSTIDEVYVVK